MTDSLSPPSPDRLLADQDLLAFSPVPMDRDRANGWTHAQQERFIPALHAMGSANQSAKIAGMRRQSAYNLRKRPKMTRSQKDAFLFKYINILCVLFDLQGLSSRYAVLGVIFVSFGYLSAKVDVSAKGRLW